MIAPDSSNAESHSATTSLQRLQQLISCQTGVVAEFRRSLSGDYSMTYLSENFSEIFGIEPDAVLADVARLFGAILPDDIPSTIAAIEESAANLTKFHCIYRIITPTGVLKYIEVHSVPRREIDGSVLWIGNLRDISERRKTELALATAHARQRTILDSMAEGLVVQDDSGKIIECNVSAQKILGLSEGQLLGRDSMDPRWRTIDHNGTTLPGDQHPAMVTLRTGKPIRDFEMGVRRPDSSEVWLSINSQPVVDAAGKTTMVICSFSDTTAYRAAMRKTKIVTERFLQAVTASRISWFDWDIQAGIVDIHADGVENAPDFKSSNFSTDNAAVWLHQTHPEDLPHVRKELHQIFSGGTRHWDSIHRLQSASGNWRWMHIEGKVSQINSAGAPLRILGTAQDIHKQYEAEKAHTLTQQRLEMAIEASQVGIWRHNLRTGISEWDDRMLQIYGRTAVTRDLNEFNDLVHPDDRAAILEAWKGIFGGMARFSVNFRIRHSAGHYVHLHSEGAVHRGTDGEPEWVAGINRDITAEVAAEEHKRALEHQLRQSQKLETLGTLASGIAHDFNNLLTGINGHIELALTSLPSGHEIRDLLERAKRGGETARDLVKRILLFARRSSQSEMRAIDLATVVHESAPLISASFSARINLEVQIEPGTHVVWGDQSQLQQVLMNLCVNAAQAIGTKNGTIVITLDHLVFPQPKTEFAHVACKSGPHVRLSIKDDGCGMDDATREQIFDPFFTTKDGSAGSGLGLGLSIVQNIVTSVGGAMHVKSAPSQGSIFTAFFPAFENAASQTSRPKDTTRAEVAHGNREAVLILDDEAAVLNFTKTALKKTGFTPTACRTTAEVLTHLKESPPGHWRLLISDITMPGESGLEFAQTLRQRGITIPIVLISGDTSRIGADTLREIAPARILEKPFDMQQLLAAVHASLGKKTAE